MKKLVLIFISLMVSLYCKAQNPNIAFEDKIIKVKLVKSISDNVCDKKSSNKTALIIEFDVLTKTDKKVFGNKIYAAIICSDFPGEGMFDRNKDYNLQLYDHKDLPWEISILNEDLFEKNIGRKTYWIKNIGRKFTLYCGPKKI